MENKQREQLIASQSMRRYIPLSLGIGITFALIAFVSGRYSPVAVLGGTVWVILLSLIVSMPLIISQVKKSLG